MMFWLPSVFALWVSLPFHLKLQIIMSIYFVSGYFLHFSSVYVCLFTFCLLRRKLVNRSLCFCCLCFSSYCQRLLSNKFIVYKPFSIWLHFTHMESINVWLPSHLHFQNFFALLPHDLIGPLQGFCNFPSPCF